MPRRLPATPSKKVWSRLSRAPRAFIGLADPWHRESRADPGCVETLVRATLGMQYSFPLNCLHETVKQELHSDIGKATPVWGLATASRATVPPADLRGSSGEYETGHLVQGPCHRPQCPALPAHGPERPRSRARRQQQPQGGGAPARRARQLVRRRISDPVHLAHAVGRLPLCAAEPLGHVVVPPLATRA